MLVWAGVVLAWAGAGSAASEGEGLPQETGELERQLELLLAASPEEETVWQLEELPGNGKTDEALAAGLELAVRGQGTKGGEGRIFTAADESSDAAYTVGASWIGQNGGTGFEAWRVASGSATPDIVKVAADGGFLMQAGETAGEMALVRGLETETGLTSGEFTVTVWGADGGADEEGDFSGFALYGAGDRELFRWGFRLMETDSAFVWSADGGGSHTKISEPYPGGGVDYILTWMQLEGKTMLSLTAESTESPGSYYFRDYTVTLDTVERVMAVGAVLTEGGLWAAGGDGSEMQFDHLKVTGREGAAVPEPGVLGLLAVGMAGLFGGRRRRK